jgi:YgiT-type zinc finger domain-containing protein
MKRQPFEPPKDRKKYPSKCPLCGGIIEEAIVTVPFPDENGGVKLVQAVPAGVCGSCREEYLTAEVAESLENLMNSQPYTRIDTPVWKYAANL